MMFQIKKAIRYSLIITLIIGGVGVSYGQEQVDEAKQEIKEKKTGSVKKAEKRFDHLMESIGMQSRGIANW